ncbi:lipase member H-like [Culex pipiens pallens]|uniref:lipase member H-like n=1 Tax=Culex pipiens pallens TaxID=42434 RepID=UPI001953B4F5|nr:lipase member H-like [Culex pipiens pallens]
MYLPAILLGTLAIISSANGGLKELFSKEADNNIGQLMDTMALLWFNNFKFNAIRKIIAPVETLVLFFCGHSDSTTLQETRWKDPGIDSKLNLSKPVTFVIHGWTDDAKKLWVQEMAQSVISEMDTNVVVVQWERLAAYQYEQAAKDNTLLVSGHVSKFIRFLVGRGVALKDVTLIGHSLGAHICGQIGFNFDGEIGQIYGLDPARAYFTVPVDRGLQFRLDSTDAHYVQMVITSRGEGGVLFGDGHDNFYPNGGNNPQPNCVIPVGSDAEFALQLFCSHMHSTTLFRLSLNASLSFEGNRCNNYARFLLGSCDSNVSNRLGVFNSRAGGDFYFRTLPRAPFAQAEKLIFDCHFSLHFQLLNQRSSASSLRFSHPN